MDQTLLLFEDESSKENEEVQKLVEIHNRQFQKSSRYQQITPKSALDPKVAESNAMMLLRSALYQGARKAATPQGRGRFIELMQDEMALKEGRLPAQMAVRDAITRLK